MDDLISREKAIEAMKSISDSICEQQAIDALCELPPAQPEPDKEKISDLLLRLYLIGLVNLPKLGIVRRQHCCEDLWKAMFHDDEFPWWMHWS